MGTIRGRHLPPAAAAVLAVLLAPGECIAYEIFFGNFHAHTAYSDGIGAPGEAFAYARDVADIDVLALTDHTHMLSSSEWSQLAATAEGFCEDGVFVALGAQEFGNLNDFGHMNLFDCADRNPYDTADLLSTYQFLMNQGGFGVFAHPNPAYGTNFNDLGSYPAYLQQMIGLEIRNGQRISDYEEQYVQALLNGWRIAPLADQDNHEGHWGDQVNPNAAAQIYLTGILAEDLTAQSILDALRKRRFYAAEVHPQSDRIDLEFYAADSVMGSSVVCGANLALSGTARSRNGAGLFNRVDLYEDGIIVDGATIVGPEIAWVFHRGLLDGEEHFYFVRVRQVDGDHAWSAPIWVRADVNPASAGEEAPAVRQPFDVLVANPSVGCPRILLDLPPRESPYDLVLTLRDAGGRLLCREARRELRGGRHAWSPDRRPGAGVYFLAVGIDGREPIGRRITILH